jgi:hypothetical protein
VNNRDEANAQIGSSTLVRVFPVAGLRVHEQERPATDGVSAIREEMRKDEVSAADKDHETTAANSIDARAEVGSQCREDGFAG